jgi:hypothetical protein
MPQTFHIRLFQNLRDDQIPIRHKIWKASVGQVINGSRTLTSAFGHRLLFARNVPNVFNQQNFSAKVPLGCRCRSNTLQFAHSRAHSPQQRKQLQPFRIVPVSPNRSRSSLLSSVDFYVGSRLRAHPHGFFVATQNCFGKSGQMETEVELFLSCSLLKNVWFRFARFASFRCCRGWALG